MSKKIKITETQLRNVIDNIISEIKISSGNLPSKGFDGKFSCIVNKNEFKPIDLNNDGVTDFFQKGSLGGQEIRYYPNGILKIFRFDAPTPHWENSKWYCSSGKVVMDNWLKNTKFKTYKNNNPFINDGGAGERMPLNTTDNGSNGKWVSNMQKKLMDLKLLSIPRPTGNYGKMTQQAVLTWAQTQSDYTNQGKGITKDAYNRLVNFKPTIKQK